MLQVVPLSVVTHVSFRSVLHLRWTCGLFILSILIICRLFTLCVVFVNSLFKPTRCYTWCPCRIDERKLLMGFSGIIFHRQLIFGQAFLKIPNGVPIAELTFRIRPYVTDHTQFSGIFVTVCHSKVRCVLVNMSENVSKHSILCTQHSCPICRTCEGKCKWKRLSIRFPNNPI
jgi:hypothetical protein